MQTRAGGKKILIVRFSSIGDIVLTTPVIRCLKQQIPDASIHFITKEVFSETLAHNPYIDKLWTFRKDFTEIISDLKSVNFDYVVDLHKNLRSLRLKQQLNAKSYSFKKLNLQKLAAVKLKLRGVLPDVHIVQRFLDTLKPLMVKDDGLGMDYFTGPEDEIDVSELYLKNQNSPYTALVVGGSYYTKKIPSEKLDEICALIKTPIIAIGGKDDSEAAERLQSKFSHVVNACGKHSINQSAFIIKNAAQVVTSDTGMMHIAAAFDKKIISLWGNTIPEFGMSPYKPNPANVILQVKNLSCRPCSKLGYSNCPKGHFKCMKNIEIKEADFS